MRQIITLLFIFCALCFFHCGGDNRITEVGNPTTTATTTHSTTKVLTSSVDALANSFSGQALAKGLRHHRTEEGEETTTTDETLESCSYDEATNTFTCACEGGGTMSQSYNDSFDITDDSVLFVSDLTMTFSDCLVPSCSEYVIMNGTATGSVNGSFNFITGEESFSATFNTPSACSGITAGSSNIGFEMNMTFNGATDDYSGTFCVDNTDYSFSSLAELEELTDPVNACGEEFGFNP